MRYKKMKNYSKNAKLNRVLNEIRDQLLSIHDTENESIEEIKRYVDYFGFDPQHLDYFIYEHGNVLVYNYQIRELYKEYKSLASASIEKLIEIYKRQVGCMARELLKENNISFRR